MRHPWGRAPANIICDGCANEREDAVYFDKDCRTRKCVMEKGYDHCGCCESYPCEIFPAEPSPEEFANRIGHRGIPLQKVYGRIPQGTSH